MPFSVVDLNELIARRRAIFPQNYIEKTIPRTIIEQVLENANWAPTHKLTEPWRFKVFYSAALQSLSRYLGDWYTANTPADQFSEKKFQKTVEKPLQSGCVIAICMQRDPKASVPKWEEIAAVGAAVQNMWLTCTAYGIGCYWSSPPAALQADRFLNLKEGERCLGLFYMGYHDGVEMIGKRTPVGEKVEWV